MAKQSLNDLEPVRSSCPNVRQPSAFLRAEGPGGWRAGFLLYHGPAEARPGVVVTPVTGAVWVKSSARARIVKKTAFSTPNRQLRYLWSTIKLPSRSTP